MRLFSRPRGLIVTALVTATIASACSSGGPAHPSSTPSSGSQHDPVIAVAGDIETAGVQDAAGETAAVIERLHPTAVLTVGDNQYNNGSQAAFEKYFNRTWGRFKSLIHPTPGHHEYYLDHTASGYFTYFGAAANNASQPHCTASCDGYYSFDLGDWHLVALNTNHYRSGPKAVCAFVACAAGSSQVSWLKADLRANTKPCVLAYWSDPRWSSGTRHGSNPVMGPIWDALYAAHADLAVNGHEHMYERFGKQDPGGGADQAGIREMVTGTGGNVLYPLGSRIANSQRSNNTTHGVLDLTLHPHSYSWRFVPVSGETFTDSGTTTCNRKRS